ncbi:MAG: S8 family serine peptidase [Candidatus Latescibacterota bacterium]
MKKLMVCISLLCILLTPAYDFTSRAFAQIYEYKDPPPQEKKYVPGEVLVKFKAEASEAAITELSAKLEVSSVEPIIPLRCLKMCMPKDTDIPAIAKKVRENLIVEYAEPNYYAQVCKSPNDPYYIPYQWNLRSINLEKAWDIQPGSSTVIVAIIDTGVAYENHTAVLGASEKQFVMAPDLANTIFVPGYDFVENDSHPNDDDGHGTHVAGTIAQSTNNGLGTAGVTFDCCAIMPIKVLDNTGSGSYAAISHGIVWAADHGAKVINMSLGGGSPSSTLESALRYAYSKGVTIVAAAGNNGYPMVSYPAAYDEYVIAVGATRYDNQKAGYSSYGSSLDLVAPGGDIVIDQNRDGFGDGIMQNTFNPNTQDVSDFGYWFFQGTSMAAPHVAGAAALLYAQQDTLSPDDVRDLLQSTARDLGNRGRDDVFGYGLIDIHAALSKIADVRVLDEQPGAFEVRQNTPNPFNPGTLISFTLARENRTTVEVFNAAGQKVDTILDAILGAGQHAVSWDASRFSAGVYFYTVRSGEFSKTMKMTVLK